MVLTIVTMFIFLFYVIYHFSFVIPREEKIAFRLFELRDRVAMLVINGDLSEDDFEYIFMIHLINTQIRFLNKEIPYTEMFTSVFSVSDEEVSAGLDLIYQNALLKDIYEEVIDIYRRIFKYKKYVIKYIYVAPVSKLINLALRYLNLRKRSSAKTKKSEKRELCQYRDNVANSFGMMERMIGISHNSY